LDDIACIDLMTGDYRLKTISTAVTLAEQPAAFVSFQWQQGRLPPTQNVDSAVPPLLSATQFSGSIANNAVNAVTTALFATY